MGVRRLKIVILSHAAGASGMYFFTGSSTFSFPVSPNSRIADEMVGVLETCHSKLAKPQRARRTV